MLAEPAIPYWRLSGIYLVYFTVVGAVSPYWGLYLSSLGLSASSIGLLAAIPLISKLIAPNVWGYIADKTGRELLIIRLGAFGGAAMFAFLVFRRDFFSLVVFIFFYSFFWNAILPQFETVTLRFLLHAPHNYSRIRVWGSVGFILSVLGLGYFFDVQPISYLPAAIFMMLCGIFLLSLTLTSAGRPRSSNSKGRFVDALLEPKTALFFFVLFLLQLSHGVYYVFFSIYLEAWGYSKSSIGWLWALGVISEIGIFLVMSLLLKRFSLYLLLSVSFALTALRWLGIAAFPQTLWVLVCMQILHAFSFGVIHACAIDYLRRHFDSANQGQAQAFYSAFSFGGGAAVGAYLSGLIWDSNAQLTFVIAGVIAGLACVLLMLGLRNRLAKHDV